MNSEHCSHCFVFYSFMYTSFHLVMYNYYFVSVGFYKLVSFKQIQVEVKTNTNTENNFLLFSNKIWKMTICAIANAFSNRCIAFVFVCPWKFYWLHSILEILFSFKWTKKKSRYIVCTSHARASGRLFIYLRCILQFHRFVWVSCMQRFCCNCNGNFSSIVVVKQIFNILFFIFNWWHSTFQIDWMASVFLSFFLLVLSFFLRLCLLSLQQFKQM